MKAILLSFVCLLAVACQTEQVALPIPNTVTVSIQFSEVVTNHYDHPNFITLAVNGQNERTVTDFEGDTFSYSFTVAELETIDIYFGGLPVAGTAIISVNGEKVTIPFNDYLEPDYSVSYRY